MPSHDPSAARMCDATVRNSGYWSKRHCTRTGKIEVDGAHYCAQHAKIAQRTFSEAVRRGDA